MAIVLAIATLVVVALLASRSDEQRPASTESSQPAEATFDAPISAIPRPLFAAEVYASASSRDTAHALLMAIGGPDSLVIGEARGAFDLVTFDPLDIDVLLASHRSTYGPADNSHRNERWVVDRGRVRQDLFDAQRPHDVVHYTPDGQVAVWSNSGNSTGFASRIVSVEGDDGSWASAPIYASRSVIADGTLFALTGDEDYYATSRTHERLVADDGASVVTLDDGGRWARVDRPMPGIVVTYPRGGGSTLAWEASTMRPLPDHWLSGHAFTALAVSGDGLVAVGIDGRDRLVRFTPSDVSSTRTFGSSNPTGVPQPVTLSGDGRLAVTVDRGGAVLLWWVGDDRPLATFDGTAGPGRVSPEHRAPYTASAVDPGGRRVAVKRRASGDDEQRWQIVDVDVDAWVARACSMAGRPLTPEERSSLGLVDAPAACG